MPATPLAVIDIGSNSARMVVVRGGDGGHLEVLVDARVRLKLIRALGRDRRLSEEAIGRTLAALRGFLAIAERESVSRVVAVATAAVREAANHDEVVARLGSETGIAVRIIDGDEEARLACLGAIRGLPADSGMVLDIGGGSLELARFRDRRQVAAWTLPLGALRLSDRFLLSDPPRPAEIQALEEHVREQLSAAGISPLAEADLAVGTGGTIRGIAKVDRARAPHTITRLHGYVLRRGDVGDAARRIAAQPLARRSSIRGLSSDRADSIAGGALTLAAALDHLGAREMVVSGQGLREGLAQERLSGGVPASSEVRRAAVAELASRFRTWSEGRAASRRRLAGLLIDAFDRTMPPELREALEHTAVLADSGRSVDFYSRWQHTAAIVLGSDLMGFSHRGMELIAAIAAGAGGDRAPRQRRGSLLTKEDRRLIERAAVLLVVADELARRLPPGATVRAEVQRGRRGAAVVGGTAGLPLDGGTELGRRFRRVFGRPLRVEPEGDVVVELK